MLNEWSEKRQYMMSAIALRRTVILLKGMDTEQTDGDADLYVQVGVD